MKNNSIELINNLLSIIENNIIPLTKLGVQNGNKLFGAAILKKSDYSLVVAATNNETENPLWHGEIQAIKQLYELPKHTRPSPKDCLFLATHEPCSLCLSAITWGGYDNFYYLFSYTDSRDSFNIPYDLKILSQVFKCNHGDYARNNDYWNAYNIVTLVKSCDEIHRNKFETRINDLKKIYSEMSDVYQKLKHDSDIPLC